MDTTAKTDPAPVQERPARRKFLGAAASGRGRRGRDERADDRQGAEHRSC